jgi:hypothetical protein
MTKVLSQDLIEQFYKQDLRRSKKLSKKLIEQNQGRGKRPSRKGKNDKTN